MSNKIVTLSDPSGNFIFPQTQQLYPMMLTINGDANTVATWCKNHYISNRMGFARVDHPDNVWPFGTAAFSILYCLSSVNYGMILGVSDSANTPIAVAQIRGGTVYGWYPIQWEDYKTSTTSFKDADGTTDTRYYAGALDLFHERVQNGTYATHSAGVAYITTTGPAYGILYEIVNKNYYSGKLFGYSGDFQSGFTELNFSYVNGLYRIRRHLGG